MTDNAKRNALINHLLYIIFNDIEPLFRNKSQHPFILKGGMSLKLGREIIRRETDDIDLSFSTELLGLKPIVPQKNESRSSIEERANEYDSVSARFLKNDFLPDLKDKLLKDKIDLRYEDGHPLNIYIVHENMEVKIETGARSLNTPAEYLKTTDGVDVWTLSPVRTLMEKIFGIHTDNIRNTIHHSHVKFLYDIVMIYHYNPELLSYREFLNEVADFNYIYYRWNSTACRSVKKGPILLVPGNFKMIEAYKKDWEENPIFFNRKTPFSFNSLISELETIESVINKI